MTPAVPTDAPGFAAYQQVRAAVLAMKRQQGGGAVADPSAYWAEELDNIDYLAEASPLIVRKLRHHAFQITGIRPYDYRSKGDGRREYFEARLRALEAMGSGRLGVPESPILGGFGYEIDGRLYNVDTLKFHEVLVGMERAGAIDALRRAARPVVCEIGAGWGGFAYQLKTLVPSATYVIVDFAELFLFSATYLATAFPEARLRFCTDAASLDGWRDADVVFVPHTLAQQVGTMPLDLMVNMVSFQEMTEAQVRAYAAMAARAGCPWLYSLNRERSPYNTELASVSAVLAERYDLSEIALLGTDYTSATKKPPKAGSTVTRSELGYRHLAGRLRTPVGATGGAPAAQAAGAARGTTSADRSPRVVLGMTLYNNAAHLPEAMESLLGQTHAGFALVLLDDASSDATEAIAREYAARDSRVRYIRHDTRKAMVATWREVAEIAARDYPSAPYFAWVSDHDRWHPRWLERLLAELDGDPGAVLAYPITERMTQAGEKTAMRPRYFDTASCTDLADRWRRFCHRGIGAGDMVYGLVRMEALRRAGVFRPVLSPDRLLIAELTLRGRIRQVQDVLWYRRESNGASIARQQHTLLLPGDRPAWFWAPPWLQHAITLRREYVLGTNAPSEPVGRMAWRGMLTRYMLRHGWRHFRKTSESNAIGQGIEGVIQARKQIRHHRRQAVYGTLVAGHALWGRTRRVGRRAVYEVLMLARRLGLRGSRGTGRS